MVGKTLSHYKILSELGRGGMGIVYQAEDTRLNRTVAIKVLPAAALAVEDDRARFYREARAAASLSHPNIAVIHEIDEARPDEDEGSELHPFIAMEFIDGETLDARIRRGPLDLPDAIRIATEVADGLRAAHTKDIVHRDIKSANIMIDQDGRSKILDFGLAKTTQSTQLTRMGSTLGTIAYMSPEQARGEEVDRRTDLWAVGVLLYEMISGSHPFTADYEQATVYTILNEDPAPLTAIRTGVPMDLEHVVGKCLKKEADTRYQHADDLIADLKGADTTNLSVRRTSVASGTHLQRPERKKRPTWMLVLAGLALLAVGALSGQLIQTPPPPKHSIQPFGTENLTLIHSGQDFDISPNGDLLVFRDSTGVWSIHSFISGEVQSIPNSESGFWYTFSPEGDQLVYTDVNSTGSSIMIRPIDEGDVPKELYGPANPQGLDWSEDGRIIWSESFGPILSLRADGSQVLPDTLARLPYGDDSGFSFPSLLPDGDALIAVAWGHGPEIVAIDLRVELEERELVHLQRGAIYPAYAGNGILTYVLKNELYAQEFDPRTLVSGERTPITEKKVIASYGTQTASYVVSRSGRLLFFHSESDMWNPKMEIRRFDGGVEPIRTIEGQLNYMTIAPDGRSFSATVFRGGRDGDIWFFDLNSSTEFPVSDGEGWEGGARYSSDGQSIYYLSQSTPLQIARSALMEGAETEIIGQDGDFALRVLEDDRLVIYRISENGDKHIFVAVDSTNTSFERAWENNILLNTISSDPDFSPDGSWVVEGEGGELSIRSWGFGNIGPPRSIGRYQKRFNNSAWSADSKRYYFANEDGIVYVSADSNPPFSDFNLVLESEHLYIAVLMPDESGILTVEKLAPIQATMITGLHEFIRPKLEEAIN